MKIAFRIDISESIGTGHFVRMSALAAAFRALGCEHTFFTGADEPIDYEPFDIVVLDTYEVSSSYISKIKKSGKFLVCYDDNALYNYDCDVLLNSNFHAHELRLKTKSKPLFLLGPKYALLREEFQKTEPIKIRKEAREVFVCFGGTDVRGFTPIVLKALKNISGININVVLGAATVCDEQVLGMKNEYVQIYKSPKLISEIMAKCDIAFTGAGSMVYELACLGIPAVVFVQADNQRLVAAELEKRDLMKCGGDWNGFVEIKQEAELLLNNYERRKNESSRLLSLVNKHGALAAAKKILECYNGRGEQSGRTVLGCNG